MSSKRGRKPHKKVEESPSSAIIDLDQPQVVEEVKEVKIPKEFNHTTYLPKNTVVRIITEKLQDSNLKLAQQSQSLILDIAMQFVDEVADQANEICTEASRTTILPDHIVDAV